MGFSEALCYVAADSKNKQLCAALLSARSVIKKHKPSRAYVLLSDSIPVTMLVILARGVKVTFVFFNYPAFSRRVDKFLRRDI